MMNIVDKLLLVVAVASFATAALLLTYLFYVANHFMGIALAVQVFGTVVTIALAHWKYMK